MPHRGPRSATPRIRRSERVSHSRVQLRLKLVQHRFLGRQFCGPCQHLTNFGKAEVLVRLDGVLKFVNFKVKCLKHSSIHHVAVGEQEARQHAIAFSSSGAPFVHGRPIPHAICLRQERGPEHTPGTSGRRLAARRRTLAKKRKLEKRSPTR